MKRLGVVITPCFSRFLSPFCQIAAWMVRRAYLTDVSATCSYFRFQSGSNINIVVRLVGIEQIDLLDAMLRKPFLDVFRVVHPASRACYRIDGAQADGSVVGVDL